MIRGGLVLHGKEVAVGDGAAVEQEAELTLSAREDGTEFLLFDLP